MCIYVSIGFTTSSSFIPDVLDDNLTTTYQPSYTTSTIPLSSHTFTTNPVASTTSNSLVTSTTSYNHNQHLIPTKTQNNTVLKTSSTLSAVIHPVTTHLPNEYLTSTTPLVNPITPTTTNYYTTVTQQPGHFSTSSDDSSILPITPSRTDFLTTQIIVSSAAPNQPFSQTSPQTSTTETTIANENTVTTSTEEATSQSGNTLNDQSVTQTNNGDTTKHGCICYNSTKNLTSEEIQDVVNEIVKNLTVPVKETSAFKRTKMSMPDKRQSSAVIGAVGVVSMTTVFGAVLAMDAMHIVSALNFVKSIFIKG